MEYDTGGCLWRYDSAQSPAADNSEVAKVFKTVLSAKVRCLLDASNQINRMEGVDELVNRLNVFEGAKLKPGMTWDSQALAKVLSRLNSGTRQPFENTAWGLKRMFSEDYFKSKFDPSFLPRKAVQPADTWSFSRESLNNKRGFLNVSIAQEYTVTFRSWEMRADGLCARLEYHGTEKTSPSQGPRPPINHVKEGTFSGVVWFDPQLGWGIEVNVNRDFKITSNKVALPTPCAKPPVQPVTDHHHQVITEKLVPVKQIGGSS
jgi:hypothetical protein